MFFLSAAGASIDYPAAVVNGLIRSMGRLAEI
jgi:hypothetical protein